jgi:hypothetical protein
MDIKAFVNTLCKINTKGKLHELMAKIEFRSLKNLHESESALLIDKFG